MRSFRSLSARLTVQFALLFAAAMLRNWASVNGPPGPEGEPEACSAASEKQKPRKTTTGRTPRLVIR